MLRKHANRLREDADSLLRERGYRNTCVSYQGSLTHALRKWQDRQMKNVRASMPRS